MHYFPCAYKGTTTIYTHFYSYYGMCNYVYCVPLVVEVVVVVCWLVQYSVDKLMKLDYTVSGNFNTIEIHQAHAMHA